MTRRSQYDPEYDDDATQWLNDTVDRTPETSGDEDEEVSEDPSWEYEENDYESNED